MQVIFPYGDMTCGVDKQEYGRFPTAIILNITSMKRSLFTVIFTLFSLNTVVATDPYAPPFYNNEVVLLPDWVKVEFRDINAKLREKLSPSDYLEILKGEYYLFHDVPSRSHALRAKNARGYNKSQELVHPDKLRAKLQQILDNPDNEMTFARAHFLRPNEEGVFFREDLRYADADLYWEDDLYVVGRSDNDVHVTACICDFWNSRTCRKDTSFAIPTSCYLDGGGDGGPLFRLKGTAVYSAGYTHGRECRSRTWAGAMNGYYLMLPQNESFASSYIDGWWAYEDPDFSMTGSIWSKYGIDSDDIYEAHNNADTSDAALPELGMKKLSERTRADITMTYGKRALHHAGNSIIYKSKLGKGWTLDVSSLKFAPYTEGGESNELADVKQRIDSALSPYSGCVSGHAVGLSPQPWVTSICTPECGGLSAFSVDDGRGTAFGIYSTDGSVRLFPKTETLQTSSGIGNTILPDSVGVSMMQYEDCSGENTKLLKVPVINEDTIVSQVNINHIQLELVNNNALHLFVHAESYSGQGAECFLLEVSRDGKTYTVLHRWAYSRSRLLPYYHQSLGYVFIPSGNDSYTVKKLLPDGGEQDLGTLFVNSIKGYAFVLPDGRYAGSPGCESFLGFGEGGISVGMEALAPWRNRPADVLEILGGNEDDIVALRKTTERWLRKQGFDPADMPAEPGPGDFARMEVNLPPLYAQSEDLQVEVELQTSARRAVTALEVRVDGVKVPQSWDADLLVPAGQSKKLTIRVPLGFGQNWIELKPVDSLGVAGAPYRFRTVYKGEYKPELYVVTLGVSDYADDGLDLQYAAKDARDIAEAFKKHSPYRVRSLTLTDAEVKADDLTKVQGFLSSATPNDCVVLYVAGHGMLDDQLEYYYAPHNFDADRVSDTGISMEALRGCLKSSPARKRLLVLDTCHSGALGEADMEKLAMNGVALPPGVRAITHRGMIVKKAEEGLNNTTQTRRYVEEMFSSTVAQDGICVLAASAGAEFAMESDEWNNGVFTTALISTLQDPAHADTNLDGRMSMDEMLLYIPKQVRTMTNNMQSPTVQLEESLQGVTICHASANSPRAMLRWLDFHKKVASLNDLSYMFDSYEKEVTDLKNGRTDSLSNLIQEGYSYVGRWPERQYNVIDYKITGNIIEIRSTYTCSNTKGKTVRGYCKSTYRISENGRIDGFADDSSSKSMPEFGIPSLPISGAEQISAGALSSAEVRRMVEHHRDMSPLNDLSYMREDYEPVTLNINNGETVELDKLISDQQTYVNRWVKRRFEVVDYAYRGRRIEIRYRYSCTNSKGKTVRGFCKATLIISGNGRIEAFNDESSSKSLPAFSNDVDSPQSL